jgi:hypothetical protein
MGASNRPPTGEHDDDTAPSGGKSRAFVQIGARLQGVACFESRPEGIRKRGLETPDAPSIALKITSIVLDKMHFRR